MFGQIPDFSNSFEFLRNLWATGSGMPGGLMPGLGAMTPPMDLDEVDKRIRDLKAVESWLQLNANLLRTTIQGLEVQRATLVALQTFGNALSPEAMQSAMENVARAANSPSAHPPQHPHPFGTGQTVSEAQADAENDEPDEDDEDDEALQAPPDVAAETASDESDDAPAGDPPLPPNAGLWWDMLQRQFSQIASSAAAASAAPFGGMAGMPGFGAMGTGTGEGRGEGGGGVDNGKTADTGASPVKPAPARKASAKKATAKKATARKPAAKKSAAAKSATKSAAKSATGKSAKRGTGAATKTTADAGTAATPSSGTPEDTAE